MSMELNTRKREWVHAIQKCSEMYKSLRFLPEAPVTPRQRDTLRQYCVQQHWCDQGHGRPVVWVRVGVTCHVELVCITGVQYCTQHDGSDLGHGGAAVGVGAEAEARDVEHLHDVVLDARRRLEFGIHHGCERLLVDHLLHLPGQTTGQGKGHVNTVQYSTVQQTQSLVHHGRKRLLVDHLFHLPGHSVGQGKGHIRTVQ